MQMLLFLFIYVVFKSTVPAAQVPMLVQNCFLLTAYIIIILAWG